MFRPFAGLGRGVLAVSALERTGAVLVSGTALRRSCLCLPLGRGRTALLPELQDG